MDKHKLEKKIINFTKEVIRYCKKLPQDTVNEKLIEKVIVSVCTTSADFRIAYDSLDKKDFLLRISISHKEAIKVIHWLELLEAANPDADYDTEALKCEAIAIKILLAEVYEKTKKENNKK